MLVCAVDGHALKGCDQSLLALNAFFQRLQFGAQSGAAGVKQLLLVKGDLTDLGVLAGADHVRVKADFAQAALLCLQAALGGTQVEVALAGGLKVGPRHTGVQAYQQLAFLDTVAFAYQYFLHQAAAQVLHCLAFGVNNDLAGAGHAFV